MKNLTAYGRDISGFRIRGSSPVPGGLTPGIIHAVWQTIFGPDAPKIYCEAKYSPPDNVIYRWRREKNGIIILVAHNTSIGVVNLFVQKAQAQNSNWRLELRNGMILYWDISLARAEAGKSIGYKTPVEKLADLLKSGAACLAISADNREADLAALKKELAGLDIVQKKSRQIPGVIFLSAANRLADPRVLIKRSIQPLIDDGKLELKDDKIDPEKFFDIMGKK